RLAVLGAISSGQYASTVIDFSSQYSDTDWSAAQVLGAPDTSSYGDFASAWAAVEQNGTQEFLTVGFDTPAHATGVVIRETWGNGFVSGVDLIDTDDNVHTVFTGPDPSLPGSPVDFLVSFPRTPYQVKAVTIYIDGDHNLDTWEEVDAIQLVTGPPDDFYAF